MKLEKPLPKKANKNWVSDLIPGLRKRQGITRLQGNITASSLLLAPVPTLVELDQNLSWCDLSARRFFVWMQNSFDLGPNDFLIVPCTFDGKKPVKGNTDVGLEIVSAAAKSKAIKRFVVIGGDPFKTYFGYGKKPSMESLVGNTMFLQQSGFKPVFVFPDLNSLRFSEEIRYKDKRDYYRALAAMQYTMGNLEKLNGRFAQFLKAKKP